MQQTLVSTVARYPSCAVISTPIFLFPLFSLVPILTLQRNFQKCRFNWRLEATFTSVNV